MTRAGESRQGELDADTLEEVETRLRSLGFSSIRIRRVYVKLSLPRLRWWITPRDRLMTSRMLEVMLEADLPLAQALEIIAEQSPWPVASRLRTVLGSHAALAQAVPASADLLLARVLGPVRGARKAP